MTHEALGIYLSNHLAGSVAALELLDQLADEHSGSNETHVLGRVHAEILADRQELEAFMARRGITSSGPRQATAWLAEKAGEIKLRRDDPGEGELRRLEAPWKRSPSVSRGSWRSGRRWPRPLCKRPS